MSREAQIGPKNREGGARPDEPVALGLGGPCRLRTVTGTDGHGAAFACVMGDSATAAGDCLRDAYRTL